MARRAALTLKRDVGEVLLTSKLQILNGTGNRRPSIALSILTGRVAEQLSILESFYPADAVLAPVPEPLAAAEESEQPVRPTYMARTVYLSDKHLRDIDSLIELLSRQQVETRRLNRSAVLRHAVEYLRTAAEADPENSFMSLENE